MSGWSTDLSKAPRGKYVVESRRVKGGKTEDHRVFKPDLVWAASKCGIVTLSWYMPELRQWEMFAKGEKPVAFHDFDPDRDTGKETNKRGQEVTRYYPPAHPFPEMVKTPEARADRLRDILCGACTHYRKPAMGVA